MRIDLNKEQLLPNNGIEISIEGFKGDSGKRPVQVFIEYYRGKLAVHVWDGSSEVTHIIRKED